MTTRDQTGKVLVMRNNSKCEWCSGSDNDEPNTDNLCRDHVAEYEGISVSELDRMELEQASELW